MVSHYCTFMILNCAYLYHSDTETPYSGHGAPILQLPGRLRVQLHLLLLV